MEALAIPFSEIPIGTVLAWYGSTVVNPPNKYRFCDGQIFTENQYPYLYQILVASGNPNLTNGLPAKQIRLPVIGDYTDPTTKYKTTDIRQTNKQTI